MRTITISILLTISSLAYGQIIPEFSALSSSPISSQVGFHSLQISNGILYYMTTPDLSKRLYKINFEGILIDSADFNADGYKYSGQLYTSNERFFLIGNANKPFTSWLQYSEEGRRSIIEFDENLDILSVTRHNLLPFSTNLGVGLGAIESVQLSVGGGSALFQPLDAHHLKGDTMMMARSYVFFDTITFLQLGKIIRLEKSVLNNFYYSVRTLNQYINGYKGAAIFDDSIYVYGSASECCVGGLVDFTNVGVFNANGDWARKIALLPQPNGLIDVAYDANGLSMKGKIFTSYTDVIEAYAPSCEAAVIDIRDTKFNLLGLAKVPMCGFYPSGTKCFAEVGNTIYFQTRNTNGNIGLCKYDTLLNLHWSRVYDFDQSHLGISVNSTPDGGCILEAVTGPNQNILKLYKVNAAGDIVSFTSFPIAPLSIVTVFPNPFADWVRIEGISESDATVEVFDLAGRLCQTSTLGNQSVQINAALPSGVYILTVRSTRSNQMLHSQKITKR
jgi:Secretion system C-terminal sorting domain